eukprot:1421902-Amphidinium_carterae.2
MQWSIHHLSGCGAYCPVTSMRMLLIASMTAVFANGVSGCLTTRMASFILFSSIFSANILTPETEDTLHPQAPRALSLVHVQTALSNKLKSGSVSHPRVCSLQGKRQSTADLDWSWGHSNTDALAL